jgi:hypothetical protein
MAFAEAACGSKNGLAKEWSSSSGKTHLSESGCDQKKAIMIKTEADEKRY